MRADESLNYNDLLIALRILRAWSGGTGFSASTVHTVHKWIDAGMDGPIPYPTSPFFHEWAQEHGIGKRKGHTYIEDLRKFFGASEKS